MFEHIGFKAAISGEKNELLHEAAGAFKAEGCSRAKDVICFKGKTVSRRGQKAKATYRMIHDSQSARLFSALC